MAGAAERLRADYPDGRFIAPMLDSECEAVARPIIEDYPDAGIELIVGNVQEVLRSAGACMIASGTATLQAAICGTPMVVSYKLSNTSYWLARLLVRIDSISLVNILAERTVVPELIQWSARPETVAAEVRRILTEPELRHRMIAGLDEVRHKLGAPGASMRAAKRILNELEKAT
jgi:lipid-A-disaccharide synthase